MAKIQQVLNPNEKRTLADGTVQEGRVVLLDNGRKEFLVGNTISPSGGGQQGGGQSSSMPAGFTQVAPESELSPSQFLDFMKVQASAHAPQFSPDVPALRDMATQQVKPMFDLARGAHDIQGQIAQQQFAISQRKIAETFDQSLDQLREEYNRRGLFFSGEALESEGQLHRDKADQLTMGQLNINQFMNQLGLKKAELTLQEQEKIQGVLQNLISGEESVFKQQREDFVNQFVAGNIPAYLEGFAARQQGERFAQARSREISDALNLQTLDIRSATAPLDLALKIAQVENIPVEQATKEANMAIAMHKANPDVLALDDALKITRLEREQFALNNLDPLRAQQMQASISSSLRKMELGIQQQSSEISNLSDGLLLGIITPDKLYSSAKNTQQADQVLKQTYVKAQESVGMSFPFSTFLEELNAVNRGQGSQLLNISPEQSNRNF